MNIWTAEHVDLGWGGKLGTWLAQFQPSNRWNGWLASPRFDAYTVVEIFDNFINREGADPYYGIDWRFEDDGTLVVEDRQFRAEYPDDFEPERIEPDEDGLYSLGAYGWIWTECPPETGVTS